MDRESDTAAAASAAAERAPVTAPGPPPLAAARSPQGLATSLQRSAGNRATARMLAREGKVAERTTVKIAGIECKTYGELATVLRFLAAQLKDDITKIDAGEAVVTRANEQIKDMEGWAAFLAKTPDQPLGGIVIGQTEHFAKDVPKTRSDIEWIKDKPYRDLLQSIDDKCEEIAKKFKQMEPAMKEAARKAFKNDDESKLASLLNLIGGITDNGLAVNDLGKQVASAVSKRAYGFELGDMGKYAKALDKLNMGLAAVNLGISLTGDKATTELEEGGRQISLAAGAFSSLGTLFKVAPHIGLYANLYLVPLTEACVKQLGILGEKLREGNRDWVEWQGKPLRYGVEQGGKPMWDFMTAVYNSADSSGIPEPPKEVQGFFMDHRDRFEKGMGSAVPTTGVVFKDLDVPKFKKWVWLKRRTIWIALYGSFKEPD